MNMSTVDLLRLVFWFPLRENLYISCIGQEEFGADLLLTLPIFLLFFVCVWKIDFFVSFFAWILVIILIISNINTKDWLVTHSDFC